MCSCRKIYTALSADHLIVVHGGFLHLNSLGFYLVKDDNGDLLKDSHNILKRWKNYFSQLLNVHNVSDARQIEKDKELPLPITTQLY
jgi:hypothetical protein